MKKLLLFGLATLTLSFNSVDIKEASYYADVYHGRKSADGSVFSQHKLTAASNHHKLGSNIKVTNIANGKTVEVKVTDRLNKKYSHRVDLSKQAFSKIAPLSQGIVRVKVEQL